MLIQKPSWEIIVATRRSVLAQAQAQFLKSILNSIGYHVKLEPVVSQGDKLVQGPLWQHGGKGLFVKELEEKLLQGEADVAIHSAKDLPADLPADLCLLAVLGRVSARDVLITHGETWAALPPQAKVGTSSLRRHFQLREKRPDLVFENLRGNVDTRLARLKSGDFAAIVLAEAGLARLRPDLGTLRVSPLDMVPAAGQGLLAIEGRKDDEAMKTVFAGLNDVAAFRLFALERRFLLTVGASCHSPVAAQARAIDGRVGLKIWLATVDGRQSAGYDVVADDEDFLIDRLMEMVRRDFGPRPWQTE